MKLKISRPHHATTAVSATQGRSSVANAEQQDTGSIIQRLVRRYQRQNRPITVNFRRLLPALNSTDRFTHLIHPYPAKLLAHIPHLFLANNLLSRPGDLVLDPLCGSGTVLLEAQIANRRAYGVDANPLARLIARVKTNPLGPERLKRTLDEILKRLPLKPSGPPPDVVNLDHWFYPSAVKQLQCLQEAIGQVRKSEIRDFFLVCLSACVRKVSRADPRLSVPVRLKLGQYPTTHPLRKKSDAHLRQLQHVRVATIFARVAEVNIARMETLQVHSAGALRAEILCSDARRLFHEYSKNGVRGRVLARDSVQLIITSPPYPGAQKYIRACSLSLGWLRLCPTTELREYKGRIIGREEFVKAERDQVLRTGVAEADRVLAKIRRRNPIRATVGATYLNEMRAVIREMHRVLKPGGHIILVAANNHASGREFRTPDYLRTIAEECGLSLTACFIDAIRSRGLMTKRNHTASVITREWVLMLTKGTIPNWTR